MVKTKKYLTGILPVIVSIAIAVLFLSQPLAQAQQGAYEGNMQNSNP